MCKVKVGNVNEGRGTGQHPDPISVYGYKWDLVEGEAALFDDADVRALDCGVVRAVGVGIALVDFVAIWVDDADTFHPGLAVFAFGDGAPLVEAELG